MKKQPNRSKLTLTPARQIAVVKPNVDDILHTNMHVNLNSRTLLRECGIDQYCIVGNDSVAESDFRGVSFSGVNGTSISGDYGLSVAGKKGLAITGLHGIVKVGEHGAAAFKVWDGDSFRHITFMCDGEKLAPNRFYRLKQIHNSDEDYRSPRRFWMASSYEELSEERVLEYFPLIKKYLGK